MNETNHQEKRLGRGLSALLGDSRTKKDADQNSKSYDSNSISFVEIEKITAGTYQPRRIFDPDDLQELADSIKEKGLIQPIILRKISDEDSYEIIAGERRFRASIIAGIKSIPAIIKKINNHEALELAIIENVQRADLSLIEEATGYQRLIDEFSYLQDQIAQKIGKSRSHIANLLRLLSLPESVKELLDKKSISMGHARAIINSNDPEKLARRILNESLTVRAVEDLVRDEKMEKMKNIPVLLSTETGIKFINSQHLSILESKISQLSGMETRLSYNSFKKSGRITIKFGDLEKLQELIKKLEKVSHEIIC